MKILGLTILKRRVHADRVWLKTDLPDAFMPTDRKAMLDVQFDCPKGTAETFCNKHFPGVKVEVVSEPGASE